ncbi:D-hexose-6-phosphate mutarotase [Neptuniibacter sp. 1_MG-2023]|uniref:D-hexose-6-phosphate mutarotase n=1 Tax=Neptuniibacter sp. 1_MG-2023 TaxID=3062662 RepID=UPI0026E372F5|nr:D-hexose-6-phosphate mutarotase [Neptuniibacter sp. 1_MG-2023]MDO6595222.1 D-hexose-6-phosphate mutarotase [Neptuniibacter sp. 1_MG-2023]
MNLADKVQALYAKYGALKGVTIEIYKQLIAVSVKNKSASATIFLQGAQLAEYKQAGERPLLWLSDQCDYQVGKPLRGGIPICWPWFGDLAKNPDQVKDQISLDVVPAHGLVREQEWQLVDVNLIDSETTQIKLELDVQPSDLWPFPALLKLEVTVGRSLSMNFEVINTGDKAFSFTSALHSYFNVAGIEGVEVLGLEDVEYIDTLKDWRLSCSSDPLRVSSEIDRIYKNLSGVVLINDPGFARQIEVTSRNAPDLVVWNPWTEKAKRLSHFADQAFHKMLCLESAHLLDNLQTLAPDQSFSMGLNCRVSIT